MSAIVHNTKVSNIAFADWRVDPDHRQDYKPGPVTVRKMTAEEMEKYGAIQGDGKRPKMVEVSGLKKKGDRDMAILTKQAVRAMTAEGKTVDEIVEHFKTSYPTLSERLVKAKIAMLLSDKKPGRSSPVKVKEVDGSKMQSDSIAVNAAGGHYGVIGSISNEPITEPVTILRDGPIKKAPKVYISTGWDRKLTAAKIGRIVETFGGWMDAPWWNWPEEEGTVMLAQHGESELRAIKNCDLFICLLPGAEGTHTELGMALAHGKKILLFGEMMRPVPFYYLDQVNWVGDEIEDLVIEIHKAMEAISG